MNLFTQFDYNVTHEWVSTSYDRKIRLLLCRIICWLDNARSHDFVWHGTVRSRYNTIVQDNHNGHHIARPWGLTGELWGCLLWVEDLWVEDLVCVCSCRCRAICNIVVIKQCYNRNLITFRLFWWYISKFVMLTRTIMYAIVVTSIGPVMHYP